MYSLEREAYAARTSRQKTLKLLYSLNQQCSLREKIVTASTR
jgi:hypothetical protein